MNKKNELLAKKRNECIAKAQKIVEKLIDGIDDKYEFLNQLNFINKTHYQDIVEEREILKICGYPVCNNELQNVPKKKYHISSAYNKVYDITERKRFCSNLCYKSSLYLKSEISNSPLWKREVEKKFKLYQDSDELLGNEKDFGVQKFSSEIFHSKHEDTSTISKNNSAQLSESNSISCNLSSIKTRHENENNDKSSQCHKFVKNPENIEKMNSNVLSTLEISDRENKCVSKNSTSTNQTQLNAEKINFIHKSCSSQISNSNYKDLAKMPESKIRDITLKYKTEYVLHVETCLREWFTVDSLSYIIGDENVKQLIKEKNEQYNNDNFSKFNPLVYEKYMMICKKFDILDIEYNKSETESVDFYSPSKPVPDYEELKKQTNLTEIKVRSFYKGDKMVSFAQTDTMNNSIDIVNTLKVLPLLHQHARNGTRRNIVLEKLKFMLPNLVNILELNCTDTIQQIKTLLHTFSFSAHNIVFKPCEWNLIILILIKLLSLTDETIQNILEKKSNLIRLMLQNHNLEDNYLDLSCNSLTNNLDQILQNENM